MQLNETVGGDDRLVVGPGFIERVDPHQLAFGSPYRIGMLALDLLEGLGGFGVALVDERIHRLIVEIVDRLFDVDVVARTAAAGKDNQQRGGTQPRQQKPQTHRLLDPRSAPQPGYSTDCPVGGKPPGWSAGDDSRQASAMWRVSELVEAARG